MIRLVLLLILSFVIVRVEYIKLLEAMTKGLHPFVLWSGLTIFSVDLLVRLIFKVIGAL